MADRIKAECSSGDYEGNGCRLDEIVADLLKSLGYDASLYAFEHVDCWRA